jgi:hypothetical protein
MKAFDDGRYNALAGCGHIREFFLNFFPDLTLIRIFFAGAKQVEDLEAFNTIHAGKAAMDVVCRPGSRS